MMLAQLDQPSEQTGVQEGHIAGHGDDPLGARRRKGGVEPTHRPGPWNQIGMNGNPKVGESRGVRRDDEDLGGQLLQDLQLTVDDGKTLYEEPAFVAPSKAPGAPAGDNPGVSLSTHAPNIMTKNETHERQTPAGLALTQARVGRLLAACLHEAIGEVLPDRLEFYEFWLSSEGLRDGSIGLAPISAVLGFLRTEDAYQQVTALAGRLAAVWTVAGMPPLRRRAIGLLPRFWRVRAALRVNAGIVRHVCSASRASTKLHRTAAQLDVRDSVFCAVRTPQTVPLCRFYAAAAAETLTMFGLPARAQVECCHAVQGGTCRIALDLSGAGLADGSAMAA